MLRYFTFLVACAALLAAQRSSGRDSRAMAGQAAQPGAVRGTVIGAAGGPLRKADVTLRGSRGAGTWVRTTDAAGAFAFENIPPGAYSISASRNGYVRSEYGGRAGVRGSATTITVGPGQQVSGLTVKLMPHAVIAGKVIDEDGEPLHRATVQTLRERWINGRRQLVPMSADSTNDLGEYRISELANGRYFLMANLGRPSREPASRPITDGTDMSYTPTFYPGVSEIGQASPISLTAGQQVLGVDFQLRKVPTYRIRGKVLDESGKPAMYAAVMAVPAEGGFTGVRSMGVVRNAEGTFEIADVTPGSYTLVVNRSTRENRNRTTGHLGVNVGNRDLEDVVLQLTTPFEVTGIVKVTDGDAPTNVRVTLEPLQQGAPFFGGTDTQMKPDGTFTISGVSAGKYRFAVQNMPPGLYLKSVTVQGQDITTGAAISASAAGVEVHLGINAPELIGVVLDSNKQPASAAWVVLVPETSKFDQYWLFRTGTTDQGGAFTITGIVPGHYTAYSFADAEEGSWHSPEFLKPFESKGVSVKLSEGGKDSLQLSAIQ